MTAPATDSLRHIQTEMDFLLAHCYQLLLVEEACFLMDRKETALLAMVDDSTLPAINIALDKNTRRTLRIWRWGVLHHCIRPGLVIKDSPSVNGCLPHSRELFLVREVNGLLRCSDDHVFNLYNAEPRLLDGPDRNEGRASAKCSPRIWRHSLLNFIEARSIK